MCLLDDVPEAELGEPDFGLLRCFTHNPAPKNGTVLESRLPSEFPQKALDALAGKTFRVYPRQLGLSPWAKTVEIVFENPALKQ